VEREVNINVWHTRVLLEQTLLSERPFEFPATLKVQ
jgi:hypothetical protein